MRGIFDSGGVDSTIVRFTPAYAGNIALRRWRSGCYQVHPRVCGEYKMYHKYTARKIGSPPRMRGILIQDWKDNFVFRFTPAYAGNIMQFL